MSKTATDLMLIYGKNIYVPDVNKTFHEITDILQDVFVNEEAIQRVMRTAVGRSTMLVSSV